MAGGDYTQTPTQPLPPSHPPPGLHAGDDGDLAQPSRSAPPRRGAARVRGLALDALLLGGPARRPRFRGPQGHDGRRPDAPRLGCVLR